MKKEPTFAVVFMYLGWRKRVEGTVMSNTFVVDIDMIVSWNFLNTISSIDHSEMLYSSSRLSSLQITFTSRT